MFDERGLIDDWIAQGRFTGDLSAVEFDGESLEKEPEPVELTPFGGQVVPELDAIREAHQSRVEAVNAVCIANGSSFRAPPIPQFHILNESGLDDDRYAEKLAAPEHAAAVQGAYAKAMTRNAFLGIEPWATFVPGVDDHALWWKFATVADVVAQYEFEIRKWDKWLGRNAE